MKSVGLRRPTTMLYNDNINNNENNNNENNDIIVRKISYSCAACDAVWTASSKGAGIITYDPTTGVVRFNKLWGTNPYWWQFAAAAICTVPAEDYIRSRDRWKPFKVSIKEGYSGCLYVFLDTYYKCHPIGKYIKDGKGISIRVSAGEKIPDGLNLQFGDLIEMGKALCQHFDMGWSRNPRWWKSGSQAFWRFERLRDFEVVDEVDYDPDDNNK
jgi:hypothetical protein